MYIYALGILIMSGGGGGGYDASIWVIASVCERVLVWDQSMYVAVLEWCGGVQFVSRSLSVSLAMSTEKAPE